jgi:hypothetical protein
LYLASAHSQHSAPLSAHPTYPAHPGSVRRDSCDSGHRNAPISLARSSSAPCLRPTRMTPKPLEASWRANSRPIPAVQPVTSAQVCSLRPLNLESWGG